MLRLCSLLAVMAMVVAVAIPAKAADEPKKKAPDLAETFKKLDANSDKKLSKEEFAKFVPTQKKLAATFKADEAFKAREVAEQLRGARGWGRV